MAKKGLDVNEEAIKWRAIEIRGKILTEAGGAFEHSRHQFFNHLN